MAERAVYKSTAAEYLDELFGGTPDELNAAYQGALGLLDSIGDAPLSDAVARLVDDGELPEETIENSNSGWRAGQRVDRMIRVGYTEAMQLAQASDEPLPIERLEVGGERGPIHAQQPCDRADRRRLGLIERHQQRELPAGQPDRAQRLVEAPRQCPRCTLRGEA
jgi:hypothetical protein